MADNNDPLDNQDLEIKDYFKNFIKTKKIEELIAYDNKLFSEVRNLESEKHVLVTQNYKKFVSATETINTIKTSLVGFEDDLRTLQGKVQNLVSNFSSINSSMDGKLKETEEIYKIKKDLKRLKFINDLPSILEKQLNEYDKTKEVKTLEKSLCYYQKCKDFIKIHKDNVLVKDIYTRTNDLIYKYRTLIADQMEVPDFNEFELEKFKVCLGLLVKIDDNSDELKKTFIQRYQYLITSKLEKMFSLKEGVNELDFATYSKVYDNYEFAINENDFLFYEEEIKAGQAQKHAENLNIKGDLNKPSIINISGLTSKFFKKGTFIWICKKIAEDILSNLIFSAYQSYVTLFGKNTTENLNDLLKHTITAFQKKVSSYLDKEKYSTILNLDPIFFREGLLCFYKAFLMELLIKFEDEKISQRDLTNSILMNNNTLIQDYICNLHCNMISTMCTEVKTRLEMIIPNASTIKKSTNAHPFKSFNKSLYLTQVNLFIASYQKMIHQYSKQLSNLNLDNFNENESLGEDTTKIIFKQLISLLGITFMILQSPNAIRFNSTKFTHYFPYGYNEDNLLKYKEITSNSLYQSSHEKIYFFILFAKNINNNSALKGIIDKLYKEFPSFKANKTATTDIRSYIEKELNRSLLNLYDAIIQKSDHKILGKLKELFYDNQWDKVDQSPVTFRLPLKELCYELYQLKIELMDVLYEEAKVFQETKMSVISDSNMRKVKSAIQIEIDNLTIRRLSIYGEHVESPQMIIYTIAKIFLKIINEFVKLKKFSAFAYQQIQIDLSFVRSFFKENLVMADIDNILEGFDKEIMKNCAFNSVNIANNRFNEGLINDMLKIHSNEFKEILTKIEEENHSKTNQ